MQLLQRVQAGRIEQAVPHNNNAKGKPLAALMSRGRLVSLS